MAARSRSRIHRSTQRGQGVVEYLAGTVAAALVLAIGLSGDPSPAEELLEVLRGYWGNYSYLISMP